MSKDESSDDDVNIIEEESSPTKKSGKNISNTPKTGNTSITTIDNDNHNNNSIESSSKSPRKKTNINGSTRSSVRLRVTPSSTSSASFIFNVPENNDKSSTDNTSEIIDETDQVERIESVRNNRNEISFRIKLINENEPQWISSKIANRKYPQAVIGFWEHHVEFT